MLLMADGSIFPSWYHLWEDLEFRHAPGLITEADLYFPVERLAVFCDGSHHTRAKQRLKDQAIGARLAEIGIHSTRVSGNLINKNLPVAGRQVIEALRLASAEGPRQRSYPTGE